MSSLSRVIPITGIMTDHCYYLSTARNRIIQVRGYKDDSIVKTHQLDDKHLDIQLIAISGDLFFLDSYLRRHVYRFDCFDPCSFKMCYEVKMGAVHSVYDTYYKIGSKLIGCQPRYGTEGSEETEGIDFTAWKFTETGFEQMDRWTIPMKWGLTEVVKLSDQHLLSTYVVARDGQPCGKSYLTTLDQEQGKFTSVPVTLADLSKMGFGMVSDCISNYSGDRFMSIKYYHNHRILSKMTNDDHTLYKGSFSNLIGHWRNNSSHPSTVIDGVMKSIDGSSVDLSIDSNVNSIDPTIKDRTHHSTTFYAHPLRSKIEQIYLPLLLPVFKGCKDLALLVVSYLQWEID